MYGRTQTAIVVYTRPDFYLFEDEEHPSTLINDNNVGKILEIIHGDGEG